MNANDALARAQEIHRDHIVIDTMTPHFIAEWVVTPAMVELGKQMQAVGKGRSGQIAPIHALARHGLDVLAVAPPEARRPARACALDGERGAPRAGAEHDDVGVRGVVRRTACAHGTFLVPGRVRGLVL